jgi:hypothetical protein
MGTVPQTRDGTPNVEYWEWKFEDEDEDEEEGKTSNIQHPTSNFQFEDKSSGGGAERDRRGACATRGTGVEHFCVFCAFLRQIKFAFNCG